MLLFDRLRLLRVQAVGGREINLPLYDTILSASALSYDPRDRLRNQESQNETCLPAQGVPQALRVMASTLVSSNRDFRGGHLGIALELGAREV